MSQVSVKTKIIEDLGRQMSIQIPYENFTQEFSKRLDQASKTAKMDGFRQGKIPRSIVEQRYGPSIKEEALSHLISHTLGEALEKEKLEPIDYPKVEVKVFQSGKPLEYSATFEIYPKISLITLDNVPVNQFTVTISESDIDAAIENLRKTFAEWKPVDRPSRENDRMVLDLNGTISGKTFLGSTANSATLDLNKQAVFPELLAKLIGRKPSEEFSFSVKMPKDHVNKEVAGKEVQFKVKVHQVLEAVLPPLDEAFLKRVQVAEGTLEALKKQTREALEYRMNQLLKTRNKKVVLDKLLELNTKKIAVPRGLLQKEIKAMQEDAARHMKLPPEVKDLEKYFSASQFETEALKHIKLGLLVREALDYYKIKMDEAYLQSLAQEMSRSMGISPEEWLKWIKEKNPDALQNIRLAFLENTLAQKLLEKAKIQKSPITYQQLQQAIPQEGEV